MFIICSLHVNIESVDLLVRPLFKFRLDSNTSAEKSVLVLLFYFHLFLRGNYLPLQKLIESLKNLLLRLRYLEIFNIQPNLVSLAAGIFVLPPVEICPTSRPTTPKQFFVVGHCYLRSFNTPRIMSLLQAFSFA